ncbi:MAG: iron ABC transporter permease [Phycisphaerales bacterium]|nr:iron ABC transporter permease [Phycisphaerales bacterium]
MSALARKSALRLAAIAAASIALIGASTFLGETHIAFDDIFGAQPSVVFWQLRVPRSLLAAAAGAALSIGGVLFQSLFRNPLATPYTLGIDTGASLGAAVAFLSGVSGIWSLARIGDVEFGVARLSVFAFIGAMAALMVVLFMARLRGGQDITHLLLAGVCVSYMSAAGIPLVMLLSNRPITNDIVIWTMGSLEKASADALAGMVQICCIAALVLGYGVYHHRAVDLLSMGDDLAASRGVAVRRTVWTTALLVGVLTAVTVANCGPIGFISLMVPHAARFIVGPHTLPRLIASALLGGAFLALCEGLTRTVGPRVVPVGVVTNLLGAAFFFFLLARSRR